MRVKVTGHYSGKSGYINGKTFPVRPNSRGFVLGVEISKRSLSAAEKKLEYAGGGLDVDVLRGFTDWQVANDGSFFSYRIPN